MNNPNSRQNLVGLALLALIAAGPSAAQDESCDDRDLADAWGIWCGVEDYLVRLTEQSPPAAGGGPVDSVGAPLVEVDVEDSDPFGGDPDIDFDEPPVPPVPPIVLPDGEQVYYRARYLSQSTGSGSSATITPGGVGTMTLNLPPAGSTSRASSLAVSGSDLDTSGTQDAQFHFDENSGDYRYLRVSLDDDPQVQGKFSAGARSGPGTPGRPQDLRIEQIDGKEQVILANGEFWNGSSPRPNDAQVLKDYWLGARSNVALIANDDSSFTTVGTFNSFVGGALTPLADIQNLVDGQAGPVYAYRGVSQRLGQTVAIDVAFGAAGGPTFSGTWSGGQVPSQPGLDPSFSANGVVQGRHIVATEFSAGVSGQLQGSFFQPNAQALGGAYDVEKANVGRFNDTFSTSRVVP